MNGSEKSSKRHLLETAERKGVKDEEFAEGCDGAKLSTVIHLLKFVLGIDSTIYSSSKQLLNS